MMRTFSLYIFLAFWLIASASCVSDEKDVFDTSAAERLKEAVSTYRQALQQPEYGWALDFYPADASKGGRVYAARFDATGTVTMSSEMDLSATETEAAITAGTEVSSLYQVISQQGVVLTFDTYNRMFHYWSEPTASWDADGYASDYEFIFQQMNATADTISLKGRKYGNVLTMHKLNMPATTYVAKAIAQKSRLVTTPRYRMTVGGADYLVYINTVTRQFVYTLADNTTHSVPFILTATGFRLYQPVTIAGVTFQNFVDDEATNTLSSASRQVVLPAPSALERFCATNSKWHFVFNLSSGTAEMNDALLTLLQTADATDIEKTKGHLTDFYIGRIRVGQSTAMVWKSYDGERPYESSYLSTLKIVDAGRHQIAITPTEKGTFFTTYSFFQPIVDYLSKASPYTVSFDSETSPAKAHLVSTAHPDVWFNLELY